MRMPLAWPMTSRESSAWFSWAAFSSATVRARENALVLAIPRDRIKAKLLEDSGFAARFYKAIAIFLSDRLRGKIAMLGPKKPTLDEDMFEADELDPVTMDTVYLAGQRFDRMLKQLVGG